MSDEMWNEIPEGQNVPVPLPVIIDSPVPLPVSGEITADVPDPLNVNVVNDPLEVDISATASNTNPILVSGNVGLTGTPIPVVEQNLPLPVTGSITVTPPANQNVTVTNTPLPVDGTVTIGNTPLPATVSGSVSVSNLPANQSVTVTNTSTSPVPTTSQGTTTVSGSVSVSNTPLPVSGTVSVGNFPADQDVTVSNTSANPVPITGNITVAPPANQPVTNVAGTTLVVEGSASGTPLPVTGSLTVTPPANQPVTNVSGTQLAVTGTFWQATQPVSGSVSVSNFPASQPVSGTVAVSNFPATQPVSGSVGVNNFPASQAVTGTFWQATQPVSGSVGITGTVPVSGTFWQATQPVSGTVAVSNFPASQAVDLTNTGTNTNPLNVSTLPIAGTPPPIGGTLVNTGLVQMNWTTAGTAATQRITIYAGPGAGSGQRLAIMILMISGFSGQPNNVGWALQFRNNAGTYNGQMWGYQDVYLTFPSPYWILPANLTNQGISITCTNYSAITGTGGITVSCYLFGWLNAPNT